MPNDPANDNANRGKLVAVSPSGKDMVVMSQEKSLIKSIKEMAEDIESMNDGALVVAFALSAMFGVAFGGAAWAFAAGSGTLVAFRFLKPIFRKLLEPKPGPLDIELGTAGTVIKQIEQLNQSNLTDQQKKMVADKVMAVAGYAEKRLVDRRTDED